MPSSPRDKSWVTTGFAFAIALFALAASASMPRPFAPVSIVFLIIGGIFVVVAVLDAPTLALDTQSSEARGTSPLDSVRAYIVQIVVFFAWLGFVLLLVTSLQSQSDDATHVLSFTLIGLRLSTVAAWTVAVCTIPKALSFAAAQVIRRRINANRLKMSSVIQPVVAGSSGRDASADVSRTTASLRATDVDKMWRYEAVRVDLSMARVTQHAGLMGATTSIILMACARLLWHGGRIEIAMTSRLDVVVGALATATALSFSLGVAGILVRAANDDASATMFARAGRDIVYSAIAAIMATGFLVGQVTNASSVMLIGASCALLGRTALRAMADRASGFLGAAAKKTVTDDLTLVDGLSEEDAARLNEEGLDSIYALALCPTARLFFNTRFSLQRICDWQDQALLYAYFGATRAAKLKEQYLIRGVLDAQLLAYVVDGFEPECLAHDSRRQQLLIKLQKLVEGTDVAGLVKDLGFVDGTQARIAFSTLINDEPVERLRVFWRAAASIDVDASELNTLL